jgi:hypothetical protein
MTAMPAAIVELVDELMAMSGSVAVVLGGSRALGAGDGESDWDIGVYYRSAIDLSRLAARGPVYPPGSWGRLMNGGAWLRCDGAKVDVLLRDLDSVDHWTRRSEQGEFEIDALLGYVAGVPTYLLSAELASCRPLRGEIPSVSFPKKLRAAAPAKWRFCRSFSLDYARMHARRGNIVGATAQAAKAVIEEAHAVMCERGRWVCNERRLIDTAGLSSVQATFGQIPAEPASLLRWVDRVADALRVPEGESRPWSARLTSST